MRMMKFYVLVQTAVSSVQDSRKKAEKHQFQRTSQL